MKKISGTMVVMIVLALFVLGWVFTHVEQPMAGATYVGLALGCRLEVYDSRVAPVTTVRLACPGQAIIHVWPLQKVKLWCPECVTNFFKQLDLREALPEINLP